MSASEASPHQQYVAALDIGTTTIRCYIYDRHVQIKGCATEQVELIYPEPHHVEIDPDQLWSSVVRTIQGAIRDAQLSAAAIATLGISTQRSTFVTWHRETGKTFHNFITWKDLRADALVRKWNGSYILKVSGVEVCITAMEACFTICDSLQTMHGISRCMYMLTRKSRFLAGSVLKLMNTQTTMRLAWMIQHNKQLQEAIAHKTAMFGTLDSWLLYRLRQGNSGKQVEHIADVSSCAATGFYDPFTLGWAQWAFKLFALHGEMMPRVVTNSHDFGHVHASVLGTEVRIGCTVSANELGMIKKTRSKTESHRADRRPVRLDVGLVLLQEGRLEDHTGHRLVPGRRHRRRVSRVHTRHVSAGRLADDRPARRQQGAHRNGVLC